MKPRLIISAFTLMLFSVTLSSPAQAEVAKNVVRDTSGDIVHAIKSGTCVRSNAPASMDQCADARTELTEDQSVVYFEFNSAQLTSEARTRLESVAQMLAGAKDVASASIVGYADRMGSADYNVRLSQRRAEAVKNYLVNRGYVDVSVAEVRALGESRPITQCEDMNRKQAIDCLAADRRVEIELSYVE